MFKQEVSDELRTSWCSHRCSAAAAADFTDEFLLKSVQMLILQSVWGVCLCFRKASVCDYVRSWWICIFLFCFISFSLCWGHGSFRQPQFAVNRVSWYRVEGESGGGGGGGWGGLVPLQDNYNRVAATATLSSTSLPTNILSLNWMQVSVWTRHGQKYVDTLTPQYVSVCLHFSGWWMTPSPPII